MLRFKLGEKLPRWPRPSRFHILQTLTDRFFFISPGGNVKQPLIGLGILHYSRGLPVYREHHGTLALLELLHKVAGLAPEGGQRLDILGDVKHGNCSSGSTLL